MPAAFDPGPTGKRQALAELAGCALTLPGLDPVARLWLRDGLRRYLAGRAPTLDAALELPLRQPRQAAAAARAALLREVAAASGLPPSWARAAWVAGVIAGTVPPPPQAAEAAAALRADPDAPRSVRHVHRVLARCTDTRGEFVSVANHARGCSLRNSEDTAP